MLFGRHCARSTLKEETRVDNRIIIMDTTLRDGEQTPGVNLNRREKLEIARLIDAMGVDIIEAGFAASSPGDFAAVESIAKHMKNAQVASLCRCVKGDIDKGAEAIKQARFPMLHVFIATSPLHMQYKLRMQPDAVLERAVESVRYARQFTDTVEFSCEDGSRTEPEFLYRVLTAAIDAGATVVNIPDTVGYSAPKEYGDMVRGVLANVTNIDKARVSVHCHNDLGLAVSNTLAALRAGARQFEGTLNGIGERAGNAAIEEVVMCLKTRNDFFGLTTGIDTKQIYRASSTVSTMTGVDIPPMKAVVGANAFRHESGIHQHGVMANRETYEIMSAADIGIVVNSMVLGKHSGRHAFTERLHELGYRDLTEQTIDEAFGRFKELADAKKEVADRDIEALIDQKLTAVPNAYELDSFVVQSGNKIAASASVTLLHDGESVQEAAIGTGPVEAAFSAIKKAVGRDVSLESYGLRAVTEGTDALGEVTCRVLVNGVSATGRGLSIDVIEASARAYLAAINRAIYECGITAATREEVEDAQTASV
jgi:2-isopropylmalate synthase